MWATEFRFSQTEFHMPGLPLWIFPNETSKQLTSDNQNDQRNHIIGMVKYTKIVSLARIFQENLYNFAPDHKRLVSSKELFALVDLTLLV